MPQTSKGCLAVIVSLVLAWAGDAEEITSAHPSSWSGVAGLAQPPGPRDTIARVAQDTTQEGSVEDMEVGGEVSVKQEGCEEEEESSWSESVSVAGFESGREVGESLVKSEPIEHNPSEFLGGCEKTESDRNEDAVRTEGMRVLLLQAREVLRAHEAEACSCFDGALAACEACARVCRPIKGVWLTGEGKAWMTMDGHENRRRVFGMKRYGRRRAFTLAINSRISYLEARIASPTGRPISDRAVPALVREITGYASDVGPSLQRDRAIREAAGRWLKQHAAPCVCRDETTAPCEHCQNVCQASRGVRLLRNSGYYHWQAIGGKKVHSYSTRKYGWRRAYNHALLAAIENIKSSSKARAQSKSERSEKFIKDREADGTRIPSEYCTRAPLWAQRRVACPACYAGRFHTNELMGPRASELEAAGIRGPKGVKLETVAAGWRLDWCQERTHDSETFLLQRSGIERAYKAVDAFIGKLTSGCKCAKTTCDCTDFQLAKLFRITRVEAVPTKHPNYRNQTIATPTVPAKAASDEARDHLQSSEHPGPFPAGPAAQSSP